MAKLPAALAAVGPNVLDCIGQVGRLLVPRCAFFRAKAILCRQHPVQARGDGGWVLPARERHAQSRIHTPTAWQILGAHRRGNDMRRAPVFLRNQADVHDKRGTRLRSMDAQPAKVGGAAEDSAGHCSGALEDKPEAD